MRPYVPISVPLIRFHQLLRALTEMSWADELYSPNSLAVGQPARSQHRQTPSSVPPGGGNFSSSTVLPPPSHSGFASVETLESSVVSPPSFNVFPSYHDTECLPRLAKLAWLHASWCLNIIIYLFHMCGTRHMNTFHYYHHSFLSFYGLGLCWTISLAVFGLWAYSGAEFRVLISILPVPWPRSI